MFGCKGLQYARKKNHSFHNMSNTSSSIAAASSETIVDTTTQPLPHPTEFLKAIAGAFGTQDDLRDVSNEWHLPETNDARFKRAQNELIVYIMNRLVTGLEQEAYKRTRGESNRRCHNAFIYTYPVKKEEMQRQALQGGDKTEAQKNMFWSNHPTVSLMQGLREDNEAESRRLGVPTTDATFRRLGVPTTEEALRSCIEYPGSPFRLFIYNAGKRTGNVVQVRWDGCYCKAYIASCQAQKKAPYLLPGERVVEDTTHETPAYTPLPFAFSAESLKDFPEIKGSRFSVLPPNQE